LADQGVVSVDELFEVALELVSLAGESLSLVYQLLALVYQVLDLDHHRQVLDVSHFSSYQVFLF